MLKFTMKNMTNVENNTGINRKEDAILFIVHQFSYGSKRILKEDK